MSALVTRSPDFAEVHQDVAAAPNVLACTINGYRAEAVRAEAQALSVHSLGRARFAVIALGFGEGRMATYFPLEADNLRALAAHMLATADLLDGGNGKH